MLKNFNSLEISNFILTIYIQKRAMHISNQQKDLYDE